LLVNVNGQWLTQEESTVSIFDRGFLFGDGVYETIRTYFRKPFALDNHLKRLEYSAKKLRIDLPNISFIKSVIDEGIEILSKSIDNQEIYIRLIITRGRSEFSLRIVENFPTFVAIFKPLEVSNRKGVKIRISTIRKIPPESIDPKIKGLGQIDKILARLEMTKEDYEAIMLSFNGYVAEGTMSNIFIISNKKLITPSLDTGILNGITRDTVIKIAKSKGIETEERLVELKELFNAEEVFLTHTSAEIVPVKYIEKIEKNIGPITQVLKTGFREYIEEWIESHKI